MAATSTPGMLMTTINSCLSSSRNRVMTSTANFSAEHKEASWTRLTSSSHISSRQPFFQSFTSGNVKFQKVVTRAVSGAAEYKPLPGLPVDLRGQTTIFFPFHYKMPLLSFGLFFYKYCSCLAPSSLVSIHDTQTIYKKYEMNSFTYYLPPPFSLLHGIDTASKGQVYNCRWGFDWEDYIFCL